MSNGPYQTEFQSLHSHSFANSCLSMFLLTYISSGPKTGHVSQRCSLWSVRMNEHLPVVNRRLSLATFSQVLRFLALFMYVSSAFLFFFYLGLVFHSSKMSHLMLCCLSLLTVSQLSAGSPTTTHRNLTSNSLSDFSDKPEKDQVI